MLPDEMDQAKSKGWNALLKSQGQVRTLSNAQGTKEDRLEVHLELKAEGRMPSLYPQEDGLDAKQKSKIQMG